MPPKRKRAEDTAEATSSTRATRSSTRQPGGSSKDDGPSTTPPPAAAKKAPIKAAPKTATKSSEPPPAKKPKTKTTTGKPPAKKAASKKSTKVVENSVDDGDNSLSGLDDDEPAPSTSKSIPPPSPASTPTAVPVVPIDASEPAPVKPQLAAVSKIEPYSPDRAASLFIQYADEDEPSTIGPEGFEKLCTDAQIPLDGALPLILAWQINAKEMGKFTKEEWTKGTKLLKISSLSQLTMVVSDLEQLLILGKPAAKALGEKKDPYDKTAYGKYAADPQAAFQTLYSYCFTLAKPEQSRNIDMETSTAFWSVLLVPKYPIMAEVLEFIAEKGTYKATNKDLWSMMLEFCRTVKPTLQDYEADGAWPTLLDDFVAWRKPAD